MSFCKSTAKGVKNVQKKYIFSISNIKFRQNLENF